MWNISRGDKVQYFRAQGLEFNMLGVRFACVLGLGFCGCGVPARTTSSCMCSWTALKIEPSIKP